LNSPGRDYSFPAQASGLLGLKPSSIPQFTELHLFIQMATHGLKQPGQYAVSGQMVADRDCFLSAACLLRL
jgi:hypothetical protein